MQKDDGSQVVACDIHSVSANVDVSLTAFDLSIGIAIQKMIDASQEIITMGSQGELGGMSLPMKKHLELEIKVLENAPRDADKLERLLKAKERQKEEAEHIEDKERFVTEGLKC